MWRRVIQHLQPAVPACLLVGNTVTPFGVSLAFVPSSCNIHCPAGFVFQKEVPVPPVLRLLWSNVQAVLLIQMRDHTLFITWWSDE